MRTTTVSVRCDLCDYGGALSEPVDFVAINGVDLCHWCADSREKAWLESGRHRVTFTADIWSCSCGERYRRPFVAPRIAAAVPSMLNATANFHVNHG